MKGKNDVFYITCDGVRKQYKESERQEQIQNFFMAMCCCDGSEKERYTNIYGDLVSGVRECREF